MNSVILLVTDLNRGGAETQLVRIARALSDRGWRVTVVSLLSDGDLRVELEAAAIPVEALARSKAMALFMVPRLIRILRTEQPDALVSFMFHANVLGRLCGRVARVPVLISSIRNVDFGGRMRDWLEKITAHLDTATTTNSERVARSLVARGIVSQDKVRVIPNALPFDNLEVTEEARGAARAAGAVGPGEFLWLTVGHLHRQKDHRTLLEAFSRVALERSEARLWIVGEGPLRAELEALRESLLLQNRVRFLGLRHDVPQLLAAADAFVLSSAWEGSPNVVLEAMGAGRPVVATDVGGVSDLIEHEATGLLVSPCDPAGLAATMEHLMHISREERCGLARAAKRRVSRDHDLEAVVDRWERLLTPLIEPPDRGLSAAHGARNGPPC